MTNRQLNPLMNRRLPMEVVRELLDAHDMRRLSASAEPGRGALRMLTSLLFDSEPIISWRAVEGLGKVAAITAGQDLELVRRLIRRLLWMMNDESGALCRRAPEAIAEILVNVPELIGEYAHLLPGFLQEEPFETGTRFAMYRLATACPETREIFAPYVGDLLKSLEHDSEIIRGYSLLALTPLGRQVKESGLSIPHVKPATISIYDFDRGVLRQTTIGPADILSHV